MNTLISKYEEVQASQIVGGDLLLISSGIDSSTKNYFTYNLWKCKVHKVERDSGRPKIFFEDGTNNTYRINEILWRIVE